MLTNYKVAAFHFLSFPTLESLKQENYEFKTLSKREEGREGRRGKGEKQGGREWKGREGKGREGKGREGKGREGKRSSFWQG
jgi:hypothetical protein